MKNNMCKKFCLFLAFALLVISADAQAAAPTSGNPYFFEHLFSNMVIIVTTIVVLATVVTLLNLVTMMVKMQQSRIYQEQGVEVAPQPIEVKKPKTTHFWQRLYKRWTDVVPMEREQEIVLEHDYDGIRELDNSLPPWWVAMFALTIIFSVVYMVYYHWGGSGPSSTEEYAMEVAAAQDNAKATLAKQANNIDETTVTALTDDQSIALGKTIWDANCVACHGVNGEGGVGPNMTDDYWLHGGSIHDIFKTIKYGVPEKGMIAWSGQLRPTDMQQVSSFILTLHGTNPPNAKEAQGEKYDAATDSTKVQQGQSVGMK